MDFWNAVGFHSEAIASSLGESFGELTTGTWNLLTETAPERASDSYYATRDAVDEYLPGFGSVAGGVVMPFSYALNITLIPSGEAIGGGIGMAVYARNVEERALGVTSAFGGIGAACSMVAGILAPRPMFNISSLQISGFGELALAPVVSMEVAGAASAAGAAGAAILNGGLLNISDEKTKNPWDEIFDRYGAELLRDKRLKKTSAINIRGTDTEKAILQSLAKESGLDLSTVFRIAIRYFRDKISIP